MDNLDYRSINSAFAKRVDVGDEAEKCYAGLVDTGHQTYSSVCNSYAATEVPRQTYVKTLFIIKVDVRHILSKGQF